MIDRIVSAVRRRPVRVLEALVALAGAFGLVIDPEATQAIVTLLVLVVGGGEVAQRRTQPFDPKADR